MQVTSYRFIAAKFIQNIDMPERPKNTYLTISLLLSIISVIVTTIINVFIAREYLHVDGKTQALFGIKELLQFGYQYYLGILGIAASALAIVSVKQSAGERRFFLAVLLSLFAIIVVFLRLWRLFV